MKTQVGSLTYCVSHFGEVFVVHSILHILDLVLTVTSNLFSDQQPEWSSEHKSRHFILNLGNVT